ncbi:hypothetical protein CUR178_02868 [Leishmania enriettii]|uniref:Uncharacterized protein n=1 Tax=Leishmania enriettii TaxID=5663 RepID=A0A836KGS7_LEIEN|nr:hypothetical protein CUR178_02868 [Leishmania enriettii]
MSRLFEFTLPGGQLRHLEKERMAPGFQAAASAALMQATRGHCEGGKRGRCATCAAPAEYGVVAPLAL